jgi:hypothetical protein
MFKTFVGVFAILISLTNVAKAQGDLALANNYEVYQAQVRQQDNDFSIQVNVISNDLLSKQAKVDSLLDEATRQWKNGSMWNFIRLMNRAERELGNQELLCKSQQERYDQLLKVWR